MPVYRLPREPVFPDPRDADPEGLVAVGGDLSPERLLAAYTNGIFPWPHEGYPLLWFSPDPRMVLEPAKLHVPRSLERTLKRGVYEVRLDTAFEQVMRRCAQKPRPGQDGTWITPEMVAAYERFHELGFAHSVEAWKDGALAGGLYGVSLGAAFFGESMFADAPDASKAAFATLVRRLGAWGFELVDAQVHTEHLARFGAEPWPRERFLDALARALEKPTWRGRWSLAGAPPA